MGKNKNQRTKGNTKPSSSGRTAELLSSRGVNSFLGFGTLSVDLPGFSTPTTKPENDDSDVTVDSDFRLVLKKATKRDSVTKIKALQEFAQLCVEKDEDDVKKALPFWPRLYCKLAIDQDRKVREAAQQAHKQLVSKVKKNLAPYLKSIMGVWLISMCDPYAPSSSVSNQAFQITFPLAKQAEALDFCKEEIFIYIEDILFEQTIDTISDPKVSNRDEREAQYLRLVAGCFNGSHLFLHTLNSSSKNIDDLFKKLINNPKYWKYANHKEPEVKRSWYCLAQALCQFIPAVIEENAAKLCPLTLGSLNEDNPLVAPTIWETSLHIMVALKDCWQYVNIKNVILPKLFKVLKQGGKGNASAIFHNLLPILSKLPDSALQPETEFIREFFESFKEGMKLDNVRLISSELNALIKAYMECLQYCLLRKKSNPDEAEMLMSLLITEELVPVVKEALFDNSHEAHSLLFHHLGCFLRYLEEQSLEKYNEEALFLAKGLKLFFSEIKTILLGMDLGSNATQLSKFVHCLHYGDERVCSKKGVRFAQEDDEKQVKATKPIRKSLQNATIAQETYAFCETVFQKFKESPSLPLLKLFTQIVVSVSSQELFSKLMLESNISDSEDIAVTFTKDILLPMLKSTDVHGNENEYVKCVVSMIISALWCTSVETELETLNHLCKNDNLVLERLIQEASELRDNDSRLAKWLKGDFIGQAMVQLANGLANQLLSDETQGSETELAWKLLQICFTINREFDPFIAPEYINTILDAFTKSLANIKPNVLRNKPEISFKIVKLLCDLAKNLFSQCQGCWDLPSAEALLLSLFQLSCKISDVDDTLLDTLEETWFLGVKKIVQSQGVEVSSNGFLQQSVKTIKKILNKKWKYNEITDIEKLALKVERLLKAYAEGLKNEEDLEYNFEQTLCCILEILLPSRDAWIELENSYIHLCKLPRTLCVSSLLDLPLIEINLGSLETDFPSFLVLTLFTSRVMEISFNLKFELDSQIIDISLKSNEKYQFVSQIPSIAMAAAFGRNIYIDHQILENHKIREIFQEFPRILALCVEKIREIDILPILEDTLQRANRGSYPHAITLAILFKNFVNVDVKIQDWLAKIIDMEQLLGLIKDKGTNVPHVIYCLMPYFNQSTVTELVKIATNMLLSDEQVSQDNDCWILGTLAVCLNSQNHEILKVKEIQECALKVLGYFVDLWKIDPNILNPNWSKKYPSSLQKTTFVSQMSSIFIAVVKNYPDILEQDMWDTILCTLVGWITRANELQEEFTKEETTLIPSILTFKLLCEINSVLNECRNGRLEMQLMPNLLTEWDELYLESIYVQIIPLFLNLGDNLKDSKINLVLEKMLTSISQTLLDLPVELILKSSKDTLPTESDLLANIDYLLEKLHPMLISSIRPLVLGSHSLLLNLVKKIPEIEVEESAEPQDEEKCRSLPKALLSTLESTSQILETLLSSFDLGDCCLVQPYTDSFTFTYAYMLSWIQMLELFSSSNSEVRSDYAAYLQKSNLLEELLANLFRLMPINPTLFDNQKGSQSTKTMFNEPFQINLEAKATFTELQRITCHVYLSTVQKLPALVRQWWHNRDKRIADIVNKFTTCYVSNVISNREVTAVLESKVKFSNMVVKARPAAREVVAKYTMEDITIELVIKLPANHPLSPVVIETGQRIGVSVTQWRNWMLQLTTFLTHQNGSILDGLSLWKRNVDKRFEGIEECMICFYVLHGGTCQLPKLTCRTCKKRFHSACLYKWFSTSQNSSCPLCRNLF